MNTTELYIIVTVVALAAGFILLLIGGQQRRSENLIEINDQEKRVLMERLEFLKQYSVQLDSLHNQKTIEDEEYKQELAWLDDEIDRIAELAEREDR